MFAWTFVRLVGRETGLRKISKFLFMSSDSSSTKHVSLDLRLISVME